MLHTDAVDAGVREHLDEITKPVADDAREAADRLREQVVALRSAAARHHLDLELVQGTRGDPTFNCYRFALGLDASPANVQGLCFDYGGSGIGRDFVSFMIGRYLVETTIADAADGDLAV